MTENKYLEHAKHNKETCDYLNAKGLYHDWVITTAFYSAIYYSYFKIFPYMYTFPDGKKVIYESFDKLYDQFKCGNQNKHSYLRSFIQNNHNEIAIAYNHLMDLCWQSRYVDYNQDPMDANLARKRLNEIIKYCTKN
jgi:hypothetical protein